MFVAKTAIPIPSRNSLQDALFSQAANSPLTLFACPPGYIAKEALADSLTRQGFSIMWLRLESEDRDPATLLLSIIESARQLQPEAGERTLERMKFNPGPIFGWPQLFVQLSDDLSECLPATTAIVLDRVERLNVIALAALRGLPGRHVPEARWDVARTDRQRARLQAEQLPLGDAFGAAQEHAQEQTPGLLRQDVDGD